MAHFFIHRPVFAWVISILIMVLGALAITRLPVAQYPNVAPPSISVSANYAGASAETLQDTVVSVIEQQLNGIDNLIYMSSSSDASGQGTITLYFAPGTDPDVAQVQVQNKVQLATPSLPQTVQQQGLVIAKATRNFMMFFTLSTEDDSLDSAALGNYIAANVLDPIRRVSGVGEAIMFGSQYAMRIWLDPDRMNSFGMTASDVITAIQQQNTQVPVGQLGANPSVEGQQLNVIMQGRTTLTTVSEFEQIVLRMNPDGSRVVMKDVARVALGAENYGTKARVNGHPSAAVAIRLAPTANALTTARAIEEKVKELAAFFPPGVQVHYPLNTSSFVRISIIEVVKTLLEAILLVFLVMYLFLQNFRATLIPTIVVPVALLGTFAVMLALGFSINVLTMFGMVLAIGILVDDAIVVVENVERIMAEEGLPPLEATVKAMSQITGALIGISLVLTAVFIPMAFFTGSVGNIYRQFSIALVASMLFSVFLALSLTPALCATLLKPVDKTHLHGKRGFFGWFNRGFSSATRRYEGWVGRLLRKTGLAMVGFAVIVGVMAWLYARMPSAFLPVEDQGYFITNIQLPVGATQERTDAVLRQVEDYYSAQPEIASFITVAGFSFNGRGQNSALSFARLKPWDEREGAEHSVQGVIARATAHFASIKDAIIFPVNPPAIAELGNSAGFDFQLQDLAGLGHEQLMQARNQLLAMAAQDSRVTGVRPQGLEDAAQLKIDIDEDKATALGVALGDINTTLQTYFGSSYVNNFINGNRVQRVLVQADAPYRMTPEDVRNVYVRNRAGSMVPLSAFTTLRWTYGAPQLQKYNGFPSVQIVGSAAPGRSTGEAMDAMEEMAARLPAGISYEWTGQSYEERLAGAQAPMLYALSLLVVFLCLAALYESWSIPISVILIVPLGILGALLAATLRGLPNDVYFKVGLLTTVGLAAKNAILIVEYAKELQAAGRGLIEATLAAVHLRLRPILMTSFAFILGVMPLVLSNGAGSASQNAIGTGVAGGMLGATVLGVFFVPVFYVVVMRLLKPKKLMGRTTVSSELKPEGGQAV